MDYFSLALEKHQEWRGKISLTPTCPLVNKDDLSTAYTPGRIPAFRG